MADAWSFAGNLLKLLGGGAVGWFLHPAKEWYGRKELRSALYRELANNYVAVLYNCAEDRADFNWLRDNLGHELSFHAHKKAAANPEAFYRIAEHGWLERSFRELEKCTAKPPDEKELIAQLQRATSTIEGIAPPADAELFKSMLPSQYAAKIK